MKTLTIRSRVPVLLLTMSAQGVGGWASFFLSPATGEVATTLSLPFSWIGWQVGTVYCATLFGCLFSGRIVDRIGASRSLQLAMVLTIFGAVSAVAFANSSLGIFWIFFGSVFIGFGYALTNPASSELLILFSGKGGGLLFSLKQSSVPLGLVVAGIATPLCTQHWGWQSCAIPLVIAGLVSIALLEGSRLRFSRTLADRRRAAMRRQELHSGSAKLGNGLNKRFAPWQGIARLCRTPHLFWLAMASVSLSPIQMTVMGYTSPFAVAYLGYSLLAGGLLLSISQGATFIARPLWGVVSDRFFGARRMIGLLAVASGVFSALLLLLPRGVDFSVAAILFSLLAACAVGWNGLFMMSLAVLSQRRRPASDAAGFVASTEQERMSIGEATSSGLFFTYGACFIGPAMVPTLASWAGGNYASIFALYGVCGSLSAVYCLRRSLRSL